MKGNRIRGWNQQILNASGHPIQYTNEAEYINVSNIYQPAQTGITDQNGTRFFSVIQTGPFPQAGISMGTDVNSFQTHIVNTNFVNNFSPSSYRVPYQISQIHQVPAKNRIYHEQQYQTQANYAFTQQRYVNKGNFQPNVDNQHFQQPYLQYNNSSQPNNQNFYKEPNVPVGFVGNNIGNSNNVINPKIYNFQQSNMIYNTNMIYHNDTCTNISNSDAFATPQSHMVAPLTNVPTVEPNGAYQVQCPPLSQVTSTSEIESPNSTLNLRCVRPSNRESSKITRSRNNDKNQAELSQNEAQITYSKEQINIQTINSSIALEGENKQNLTQEEIDEIVEVIWVEIMATVKAIKESSKGSNLNSKKATASLINEVGDSNDSSKRLYRNTEPPLNASNPAIDSFQPRFAKKECSTIDVQARKKEKLDPSLKIRKSRRIKNSNSFFIIVLYQIITYDHFSLIILLYRAKNNNNSSIKNYACVRFNLFVSF
ncbi:hypothetical protein RF11_03579 [Thelohanellus kitauei]|uniref:Uncharacterized protein n=1 Tax=Thelohanellus kitauei TaxID=669202 RepID=A0A0C2MZ38_THEKT|nr:hypothetical protein RF11_03579 [Thelohanellus kitauei]